MLPTERTCDSEVDEFTHLLQQAAALKTEQLAVDRRKYDRFPEWYQHSMFAGEVDCNLRTNGTFEERLTAANEYKRCGNDSIATEDYSYAILCYGNALGLFFWLQNKDPNWKKKVKG